MKLLISALVQALAVSVLVVPAVSGQTDQSSTVLTGAYTEEQALRGQALYYQHCLLCHGEMMNGVDQAPPLAGPQFSSIWNGETLWALVDRINTMPPTRPGSLSRQENVDVLTYMLWYNGLPLGNKPLTTEKDLLSAMTFVTP